MSRKMQPEYGMLSKSNLRNAFSELCLDDQEIEMDLDELINMFDSNQPGFQDPGCVCGQVKEFPRCEEVV